MKRRIDGADAKRRALVQCCIDIGHDALNTSGNAEEARRWVRANGFSSLIVVTSSYHMLRSRTEFERAMPGIRLVDYPVGPGRNLHLDSWWQHQPTRRLLLGEYVKFVGASVRLAVARLLARPEKQDWSPDAPVGQPSASASAKSGAGQ